MWRTILALLIFSTSIKGQEQPKTVVIWYNEVQEFKYDEKKDEYISFKKINESGPISIDGKKVFIKGYDGKKDINLLVTKIEKDEESMRFIYFCKLEEKDCILAASLNFYHITIIMPDMKIVFKSDTE